MTDDEKKKHLGYPLFELFMKEVVTSTLMASDNPREFSRGMKLVFRAIHDLLTQANKFTKFEVFDVTDIVLERLSEEGRAELEAIGLTESLLYRLTIFNPYHHPESGEEQCDCGDADEELMTFEVGRLAGLIEESDPKSVDELFKDVSASTMVEFAKGTVRACRKHGFDSMLEKGETDSNPLSQMVGKMIAEVIEEEIELEVANFASELAGMLSPIDNLMPKWQPPEGGESHDLPSPPH